MNCPSCGVPKGVGKANIWMPNGVIASRFEPGMHGILCDVDMLNHLFTTISELIGLDITPLVVEAKRKDSEYYTRSLLDNMKKAGIEPPPPEEFLGIMAANYSIPGFGRVKIVEYKEMESIVLEMENVYNVPMAQGQAAGVFEAVLDLRGDISWQGDAKRGLIKISVREEQPEFERRMQSEVEAAVPIVDVGDRTYLLCDECSAPLELSLEFDWDVERASILERRSGKRYIFDNTRGITAVMRVLVEELGEDAERLLVEVSRDYSRDYYSSLHTRRPLEEELARLPLMGWGLPTALHMTNGSCSLQVINPLYSTMIAGWVWGLVETSKGKELDLDGMDNGKGTVYLNFSPS